MENTTPPKIKPTYLYCAILVFFHLLSLPIYLYPGFIKLVPYIPYTWIVFLCLIVLNQARNKHPFWIFLSSCFLIAFIMEVFNMATGMVYGEYTYGDSVGIKFFNIPVLMGLFWTLMIYSVGAFLKNFSIEAHTMRALYGAGLMVLLDVVLEPVAIKYDYWSWPNLEVPFQRYVGWFVFSFIMLRFLFEFKFHKRNLVASVLLIAQLVFYTVLNLWVF